MPVSYPATDEGSIYATFADTFTLIFWRRGSAIPTVMPQVVVSVAVAYGAYYAQEHDLNPLDDVGNHAGVLAFLLCFLSVFKVQTSYNQYWSALGSRDAVLNASRYMAISATSMIQVTKETKESLYKLGPEKAKETLEVLERVADHGMRRVLRLLALHFFIVLEYFQRTGSNATQDAETQDRLREDVRSIATANEMRRLYPKDPGSKGSASKDVYANSAVVIMWMQMTLERVENAGVCNKFGWNVFNPQMSALMQEVQAMNKIDKTQFPLPYAQMVKILTVIFVTLLPFQIVKDCGIFTLFVSGLVSLGFFGLHQVSEILESPFGNDPNDIDLHSDGLSLMHDIQVLYSEAPLARLDFNAVFDAEKEVWSTVLTEPDINVWNDVEGHAERMYTECCGCITTSDNYEEAYTRSHVTGYKPLMPIPDGEVKIRVSR